MASQEDQAAPRSKGGKAKRVLFVLGALVIAVAGYEGWHWYSYGRFHEETDDAYLQADLITLQAKDTGYIAEILVGPNAAVKRDQIIARIDPQDYQLALEKAQNSLASAQSAEAQIGAQIASGHAAIEQASAAISAASATNDGAQKSYRRAQELRATTAGTQAALDQAEATAKSAAAQVKSAEAALTQAQAELTVLDAKRDSAKLDVRAAETGVKLAERDLTFTEIRAPFDGILTERQIEVGSFVTTGSRIGTMVPIADVYVEANFKETQIADIRPGARVSIKVDAWPDQELHGTVESLTAGTGQVFSLLPASNATGNFTKVVQRVPVRIVIDDADRARLPLRPGMSVVTEIDLRTGKDQPLPAAPQHRPADDTPLTSSRETGAATSQLAQGEG
ncbi:HlyD family secretion protein [Paracoccus laeviglucosivorans]|uniref:Membrane fusion protein, multidrug efflux system n=1 Tax=Paracoccus laeviglucosivorans TaxID=1197861 RepID=A0A521ETI2_9RHOB|nr:HlyD family secretion protein [Paracoccus laeviglucosivorans]SMO87229.1 membrane fusion protein, multidrug efflux system [Paracoccus laeviglucosivorans]